MKSLDFGEFLLEECEFAVFKKNACRRNFYVQDYAGKEFKIYYLSDDGKDYVGHVFPPNAETKRSNYLFKVFLYDYGLNEIMKFKIDAFIKFMEDKYK